MSFDNIPLELKQLRQWVNWQLVEVPGAKPTKIPLNPANGKKASVVAPSEWGSFEECVANVVAGRATGIGFVFTADDEYCGIDLDDTHGDTEAFARQLKIFSDFNSYSELSPSGTGLHIIIKGSIPQGRRRACIEIYDKERYFTFTGNVQNHMPIVERQELLSILWEQMGGPAQTYTYGENKEQTQSDDEVVSMASAAVNGEKFNRLFNGDFQSMYSSQSEADFALVDIIAYYTQNAEQIARIFRSSALGQRDKAQRTDYVNYMVRKSFDRQLPTVDIEGLRINIQQAMQSSEGAASNQTGQGSEATAPSNSLAAHTMASPNQSGALHATTYEQQSHASSGAVNGMFPPGLLGEIAQFIFDASPRPVPDIALAGAIAMLSGITGRAYNISGAGLNQYILLLARTGRGKDAIADGISKLFQAATASCPSIGDYKGPSSLASSPALIKWLAKKPCCLSIFGEIGVLLQQMANPTGNPHTKLLEGTLLQMYSKSGRGKVFDPMAYSDSDKNTVTINSPSYTMIGETVPERFYETLDDSMIATGLLPRFLMFEYKGDRKYLKEGTENVLPSFMLTQSISDLAAYCLSLAHNGNVVNVQQDQDATNMFREFEMRTTDLINSGGSQVVEELWNRAHLKALKLAAVCAVGINFHNPLVTRNETMWAIDIVTKQTERLIAKFETGSVGQVGGSENKQLEEVCKVIGRYITKPFWEQPKCNIDERMHNAGVITEAVISRRVINLAAFKHDRMQPTFAIKRVLKTLVDADEIREIPKAQMQATYGCGPKAYCVSNPVRFKEVLEAVAKG